MIDELYGCTCGCCNGGVSDSAVSVGVEISDDLLDEILQEIYNEEVDEQSGISPTLFFAVRDYFHKAIDDGLINSANADIDNETAFIDALKHSADVFSLHRSANQCALLTEAMLDSDGNLKSFEQFKKDTQAINNHYNKAWLRTEYDTAVLRAQMGADWKMFQRDADVLPNLRWMPTTSVSPRDEHKVFWSQGLTLPIDDKFWNKHRPGDQWNCKCWLEQTDAEPTAPEDMPDSADMPEPKAGLRGNPAKTKEIFSQDHPHFPNKCATCHLNTDGKVHGVKNLKTVKDSDATKGDCDKCKMANNCLANLNNQVFREKAKFNVVKRYKSGGQILVSELVCKKDSDYKKLMQIARHFAKKGSKVELTPRMTRPPRTKYISYYIDLLSYKGGRYANKCPDLRIDGVWYEHEGYITDKPRNAIKNMLNHGLKQSDRLILDNPHDNSRLLYRINKKIEEGFDIEEVWLRDDNRIRLFYKNNKSQSE